MKSISMAFVCFKSVVLHEQRNLGRTDLSRKMYKAELPDMQSVIAGLVNTLTDKVIMALFVYAERSRSFSIQFQQKRPKMHNIALFFSSPVPDSLLAGQPAACELCLTHSNHSSTNCVSLRCQDPFSISSCSSVLLILWRLRS